MRVTGRLLCPSCQELLIAVDRDGVEIDYCPNCRGVWLDRGELDKIIERAAMRTPSTAQTPVRDYPEREEPYRRRYDDDYDEHYRKRKKRKSLLEELFDFD